MNFMISEKNIIYIITMHLVYFPRPSNYRRTYYLIFIHFHYVAKLVLNKRPNPLPNSHYFTIYVFSLYPPSMKEEKILKNWIHINCYIYRAWTHNSGDMHFTILVEEFMNIHTLSLYPTLWKLRWFSNIYLVHFNNMAILVLL